MNPIFIIARNAVREMVRDRTFSILFFGAFILVVISSLLGSLSLDEQRRILVHLGFGSVHLSALGIVLFQGAFVLQKEIDKQTCLMVLVRPVTRLQFLLGLWLGVLVLVLSHILLQSIFLNLLLGFSAPAAKSLQLMFGMMVEMTVVLSFVFLMVQLVRPVVGIFAGLALFLVANWLEELNFLADKSKDQGLKAMTQILNYIFPNLYVLNFRSESFLFQNVERPENLVAITIHFIFWIVLFLGLARAAFQRRDLA